MRYFITFSYDGSCFNGFQRQNSLKTVQGSLESALTSLNGSFVSVFASGRTDKGVHALMQSAHFDLDREVKTYNLKKYLNNSFDGEIYVKEVSLVCDSFHARYDAKSKIYSYHINMGEFSPVNRNYQYQYCKCLDVSLMRKASMCLIGKHDFRAFCTDSKDKENCVRTIYSIDFDILGDILKITFEGDGFLRKMIRNIVGSLIEVGSLKKDVSYVSDILESNFRGGNLKCAPACGLYLDKVNY